MKTTGLCLLLLCGLAEPSAFPQGSLTPLGAPAPTMKALDQVEPRKPIDAANTPGDATSVFKITVPGSYYLTGAVTGVSGKNGISVAASNVTIDLNGFALNGVGGSLDGVHMESGSSKLTLRKGTITGWSGDGVDEVDATARDGIYENIHVTGNSGDGLRLAGNAVITACKLDHNSNGVSVDGLATIKDCTATENVLDGFYFGSGSIIDSVASSNGDSGMVAFNEPSFFKNCLAFEHDGGGAGLRAGSGGKFSDCLSRENSFGIDVGYFGNVTNCMLKNNGNGIFAGGSNHIIGNMFEGNGDGISLYENRNVIDGNQVINGGTGIKIQTLFEGGGIRNLITRNLVGNNSTNFDIAAGNRFGPIIDLTTGATPAVNGNSANSTLVPVGPGTPPPVTDPWANFTYCQEPP